jgi:hypothetical protein
MLARGILRDIGVGLNITVTPGILRLRGVVLIGTVNSGILRDAGVALNISQSWLSTTGVKQQGRAGIGLVVFARLEIKYINKQQLRAY